ACREGPSSLAAKAGPVNGVDDVWTGPGTGARYRACAPPVLDKSHLPLADLTEDARKAQRRRRSRVDRRNGRAHPRPRHGPPVAGGVANRWGGVPATRAHPGWRGPTTTHVVRAMG